MPDYDLSRLSTHSFERLVQALAGKVLGPGIVVFGDGRDGGREATFEHKVPYPTPLEPWDGYGVVQAKCRERPINTTEDGRWAVAQLQAEIGKYTASDSKFRKPDYFIFATNVVLTPFLVGGSKDRAIAAFEEFKRQSPLKAYAIWDRDQIGMFLNEYEDVRRAFAHFITPGDVLATIISQLSPTPSDMYKTFVNCLEKQFLSDTWVNLDQAGHSVEEHIPLATVFVDLPTQNENGSFGGQSPESIESDFTHTAASLEHSEGFIKDILAVSSQPLDPASLGTPVVPNNLQQAVASGSRGRFVLVGGPGQGKTTLTQFLCQIFRASIISEQPRNMLSGDIQTALTTLQQQCELEELNHRVVPRFPFKLALSDFAARYLAARPLK